MSCAVLLVALTAVGIDYGWEPVAGGGIQYIIQIDPKMFETMKSGGDVSSDLPPIPGGVRGYRVVVGNGPLPHQGEPLPQMPKAAPVAVAERAPAMATPTGPALMAAKTDVPAAPARTFAPPMREAPSTAKLTPPEGEVDKTSTGTQMTTVKPALAETPSDATAQPWQPLMFTLLGLFASLGGNVYLAIVAWTQREQFGRLKQKLATIG